MLTLIIGDDKQPTSENDENVKKHKDIINNYQQDSSNESLSSDSDCNSPPLNNKSAKNE